MQENIIVQPQAPKKEGIIIYEYVETQRPTKLHDTIPISLSL